MKKKCLVLVTVAALVFSMVGCGSTAKAYEKDMDAFLSLDNYDEDEMDDLKDDLKGLRMSTKEGKALKKSYLELVDMALELYEMWEDFDYDDDDYEDTLEELEEMEEEGDELFEEIEELLEDFCDAAEDAGVDEDDIEDFLEDFTLI